MCSAMELHSGSVTATVTWSRWTSAAAGKMSQDRFRKESAWAGRKNPFGEATRWEKCSVNVCSTTLKILKQRRWLLMRASVTPLVVSKEADDLLSAVVGNQTNIECWIVNYQCCQCELMSPPVDVSTVPSCPRSSSSGCFSPGPYLHHSILGNSYKNTKSPPPTGGVTQRSEDVTSGRPSESPNSPTKHPKSVFTLQCQTTKKKKKSYIFENLQS